MIGRSTALACILVCLLFSSALQAAVRVRVEGLGDDERTNVEARLSIRQQADRKDIDQSQVERLHQQAADEIRGALQPYGWYSPVITGELKGAAPNWTARYNIDAGAPTLISDVDVQLLGEGADNEVFKPVLKRIERRLKKDERLKHAEYEQAKTQLTDAAYAGGFLDAHWETSELRVNPDARQAQVILHLETGPRYLIGKVTLEQNQLNPKFIERYIRLKEGAPFDPKKLLEQQFALSDLGYFQSVEIEPRRAEADEQHHVPLVIHTTPRKNHRYETGVGYGTDTGARVSAGTQWRQINQYGHNFDADARISQIKNSAAANYRIPLGNEPGENLTLGALTQHEQLVDNGDSNKFVFGPSLNRKLHFWQRRVYLEYNHEKSELGGQTTNADFLAPGLSFERTKADDPIFARQGWYVMADVHGAEHRLLSDTSFLRTYLLTRGVYAIDSRTRLLGRLELGANIHDKFSDLPASQRFFAGGDQSVRGYDYQSLGRKNALGEVIGGEYLMTFTAEVERRVIGNWGVATFLDGGGADDVFPPKLYYGAGAGLRYRAPVGVFQVDLAHPLTGDDSGLFLGLRLHVGVRIGL